MISYYALLLFLPFFYVLKVMFAYHAKCWLSSKVLCCSPHSNRSHWCSRKLQEMMLLSQLSPWITLKGIQIRTWHPNLIHRCHDGMICTCPTLQIFKMTSNKQSNINKLVYWVACYLTHWLPELFAKNKLLDIFSLDMTQSSSNQLHHDSVPFFPLALRWPNTVFKSLCLILHNF